MVTGNKWKSEIIIFLAGALSILMVLTLTGVMEQSSVGRYQMEIGHRERTHIVYVIDTTTGAVRWVDNMDAPFSQLKTN